MFSNLIVYSSIAASNQRRYLLHSRNNRTFILQIFSSQWKPIFLFSFCCCYCVGHIKPINIKFSKALNTIIIESEWRPLLLFQKPFDVNHRQCSVDFAISYACTTHNSAITSLPFPACQLVHWSVEQWKNNSAAFRPALESAAVRTT